MNLAYLRTIIRSYTYITPERLVHSQVVELDQNLLCVCSESGKEHIKTTEAGRMAIRSRGEKESHSECTDLEHIVKAGKIVDRDIMHSRLNDGRQLLFESHINSAVPDRHTYTHESL